MITVNRIKTLSFIVTMVYVITLLSKGMAVLRETAFARAYGASMQSDSFIIASTFSTVIIFTLAACFETSIIAIYAKVTSSSSRSIPGSFLALMIGISLLVGTVLTGLYFLLETPILRWLAPGFDTMAFELTKEIGTILAPTIILFILARTMTALIETREKYFVTGISNLVFVGGSAVYLYLYPDGSIQTLAWVTTISLIAQLMILTLKLWHEEKASIRSASLQFHFSPIKEVLQLTLPSLIILFLNQAVVWVERSLGSYSPSGEMTAYYFAGKISLLFIGLLATPLLTFWYPKLSKARQQSAALFNQTFISGLKAMNFFLVPASVYLLYDHQEIVRTLFQYGNFSAEESNITANLLFILAPSLLFLAIKVVMERYYILTNRAHSLIRFALAGIVVNLIVDTLLIRSLGIVALAWGALLSAVVTFSWMAIGLRSSFSRQELIKMGSHWLIVFICSILSLSLPYLIHTMTRLSGSPLWDRFGWIPAMALGLVLYWILYRVTVKVIERSKEV